MIEVFEDGLVLEGVRGEVVARIIILLAMHECTQEGNYIQPVTLATFLKTMVGKSNVDKLIENCCNLEGYYLFFNSFSPISVEIFKQWAEAAFARCTALTAQRNETILDLALPCHFTLRDSARSRPMQATVMTELENQPTQGVAVTIQVKNQRNENPMQREIEELQDDDRLSAPVQLFLQIGHIGESKIQVNHETVLVYGIDCFEHLKSQKMQNLKVLEKLKLLSRTCEDVFKHASQEERDILKDMIPARAQAQASTSACISRGVVEVLQASSCRRTGKSLHIETQQEIDNAKHVPAGISKRVAEVVEGACHEVPICKALGHLDAVSSIVQCSVETLRASQHGHKAGERL
ncbi:hypothetical protein GOP47_0019034 [Adiantum capillus-veneris]|uniref:Uncharacterized protein n=1 Tax=Adiantum capillus-veneris TaxID=13818 RepID=A0A9D4UEI1_ADICA|nr:hypothetical protein GOP47_0019034 [Adiantum capillus-veneris]